MDSWNPEFSEDLSQVGEGGGNDFAVSRVHRTMIPGLHMNAGPYMNIQTSGGTKLFGRYPSCSLGALTA